MELGSAEVGGDAYEAALDEMYAEGSRDWSEDDFEAAFGWEIDGLNESGIDTHARAVVEEASPYELMSRLTEATSPHARRSQRSGQPGAMTRSRALSDTLDMLRAADRLASWVAARRACLVADVFHEVHREEGTRTASLDSRFSFTLAAQEIAPLLRVPARTAQMMLGEALRLTENLRGTWKALDDGRISQVQAQVIVEESGAIPAESLAGFEQTILETAGGLTRPKLARRCRRLREELHPESIIERKARAVQDRDVSVQPEQDGMAWLGAYLPAEQAHGIFNRVDAAARSLQGPEELRTLSQLRADVFADVLTHTCTGNPKKGTGYRGIGANVFVTVPVMTLLGDRREDWHSTTEQSANPKPRDLQKAPASLNDTVVGAAASVGTGSDATAAGPGSDSGSGSGSGSDARGSVPDLAGCSNGLLDGYGPIDPDTAVKLAAHAPSFTRILVHPETGAVLSVGRDRYRPPKHLQDWVRISNPTCVHPGCNRSSWSCEIDHVVPWAHGGRTELENLKPRCKLHHKLKTEGIWPAGQDEQGTPHLTSIGGQTYTTLPEPPPPF